MHHVTANAAAKNFADVSKEEEEHCKGWISRVNSSPQLFFKRWRNFGVSLTIFNLMFGLQIIIWNSVTKNECLLLFGKFLKFNAWDGILQNFEGRRTEIDLHDTNIDLYDSNLPRRLLYFANFLKSTNHPNNPHWRNTPNLLLPLSYLYTPIQTAKGVFAEKIV